MEGANYSDSASETDENPVVPSTSTVSRINNEERNPPIPFDTELPMQHRYLGENMEERRGRTVFEDGSFQVIPLYPQSGVVLLPGQTFPLMIFQQPIITMLRSAVASNGIFGVVCARYSDGLGTTMANIGTTAEIYEYCDEEEVGRFCVIARGRQRFSVVETHQHSDGYLTATVKILPEVVLSHVLDTNGNRCLDRYRCKSALATERTRRNIFKRDASLSAWPHWLHQQYCDINLTRRMKSQLSFLSFGNAEENMQVPNNPSELSFWVAQSMVLTDEQRLSFLEIDSPIQRLRWELSILEKAHMLCCRDCGTEVADPRDAFSMSAEGPQGTYCNPGGYVHETITLHNAVGLRCVNEEPTTECSWFPGYAWTIAECNHCMKHVGWKFTATLQLMRPQTFWGLCRRVIGIKFLTEENLGPVM